MTDFYVEGLKLGANILSELDERLPIRSPDDAVTRLIALLAAAISTDVTFRSQSTLPSQARKRLHHLLDVTLDEVERANIQRKS